MNIENKKQFATILLAVGLGLVAAFLTSQYVEKNIERQTASLAQQYQKKNSVLIEELERVKTEVDTLAKRQIDLAKKQKMMKTVSSTVSGVGGKVAIIEMGSFAVKTPAGKRALTIMIDSLSAVGGLIKPGDFVDIIGLLNMPSGQHIVNKKTKQKEEEKKDVITILFQNIQILAVGTIFEPIGAPSAYEQQQQSNALKVTLAVTPEEASLLTFAQTNGKLQLSLRAPTENDIWNVEVASWNNLSDFVLEHQGTELVIPQMKPTISAIGGAGAGDEVRPFVQIFRGGEEKQEE